MEPSEDQNLHTVSHIKTWLKNDHEQRKLGSLLALLETRRRVRKSCIDNEILEERQVAFDLLKKVTDMKKEPQFHEVFVNTEYKNGLEKNMCVNGIRVSDKSVNPKMYFWSQDQSTRLPVLTGFYGFDLGFQRSMTEIKLLGENIYLGNTSRDTVTQISDTDVLTSTNVSGKRDFPSPPPNTASTNTIRGRDKEISKPGGLIGSKKGDVNLSLSNTFFNKCNKVAIPGEERKHFDSSENLPDIFTSRLTTGETRSLWPGDPKAIGSVRRPKKKIAEMLNSFKTREEARKIYRELMTGTPCSRNCNSTKTVSKLERSYSEIPHLGSEFKRLSTEMKSDSKVKGKQYCKSTFGANMQQEISRKLLNRDALPVPFRKPTNAFLKHYGKYILEDKTPRHVNTPDIHLTDKLLTD